MKLLFSEFDGCDYQTYRFPYCVYAVREAQDRYHDLYSRGFLPYSNDLSVEDEIFYLARSVRIPLQGKIFNYKQQNILNKFKDIFNDDALRFHLLNKEEFLENEDFRRWSLQNAKGDFLSPTRLNYILSRPYLYHILEVKIEDKVLAYLYVISEDSEFIHVWYSFYDLQISSNDFGKWVLLQTMLWAKNVGFSWFYIGTCYGMSAFYKLMLSPRATYFDGMKWSSEISALKNKLFQSEMGL